MEILIAVVALVVGFALCFMILYPRLSKVSDDKRWAEKVAEIESNHEKELERRLESERQTHKVQLDEKEAARLREIDVLNRSHKEALDQLAAGHREAERRMEENHRRELETIGEHHRQVREETDRRHDEALEAMRNKFNETVNTMSEQLKGVTADMLKQRQQEFSDSSRERIGQILDPLQTTIAEMRKAVNENTTRHTELGGRLDAGLKSLLSHTQSAQASAEKLATALRGNNKIQGEWGETVLRELLESQGLTEGIHFDTQFTLSDSSGAAITNDEGGRMRPDVILHLDRGRELIIDSKVSLSAYLDYLEAETDETRAKALSEHVRSLQNHVKELSRKDYSRYIKAPKTRIDYVIMFVPNTSALMLALSGRPDLWRRAMQDNVYIADEQTLYAALRIIEMTWTQIAQAQNQERVFELAGQMIERVEQFLKSFDEIGEKLDAAKKSFDAGRKKLEQGGHSIPYTSRKLLDLGARTSKATPRLDSYNDEPSEALPQPES